MDLRLRDFKGSFAVYRSRLIWPALALFFVGGAVCGFNPSADHGRQLVQEKQIMSGQPEGQVNDSKDREGGASSPETETATFALG